EADVVIEGHAAQSRASRVGRACMRLCSVSGRAAPTGTSLAHDGRKSSSANGSLSRRCWIFFFSSRRRHTRLVSDWSSDVCSSDLADMSDEALKIALDNNLTILGTSDIHGLIDWDYDLAAGQQRTATLVLTASETADGVEAALKERQTVAVYNDSLIGRPAQVEAVVRGSLKLDVGQAMPRTTVVGVSLINSSPIDYTLENVGNGFYDEARVFTVKAGSTFTLFVPNSPDAANLGLNLRVLNTYIAPKEHLTVLLRDAVP